MDILEEVSYAELAARARFVEFTDASQRVRMCVETARDEGHTWQEIGDALCVSRQAAQQRYGGS